MRELSDLVFIHVHVPHTQESIGYCMTFLDLFPLTRQLLFIFNQRLSIRAFGRRESGQTKYTIRFKSSVRTKICIKVGFQCKLKT